MLHYSGCDLPNISSLSSSFEGMSFLSGRRKKRVSGGLRTYPRFPVHWGINWICEFKVPKNLVTHFIEDITSFYSSCCRRIYISSQIPHIIFSNVFNTDCLSFSFPFASMSSSKNILWLPTMSRVFC